MEVVLLFNICVLLLLFEVDIVLFVVLEENKELLVLFEENKVLLEDAVVVVFCVKLTKLLKVLLVVVPSLTYTSPTCSVTGENTFSRKISCLLFCTELLLDL